MLTVLHIGPPRPRAVSTGPIISPAEFDPSQRSPQLETMIHQVTAVMPQVPLSVIRKDLCESAVLPHLSLIMECWHTVSTNNVDATITNLLEGRVKYSEPSFSNNSMSQVFRRKVAPPSSQHQSSLEDRKKELLQNARR